MWDLLRGTVKEVKTSGTIVENNSFAVIKLVSSFSQRGLIPERLYNFIYFDKYCIDSLIYLSLYMPAFLYQKFGTHILGIHNLNAD